VDQSISKPLMPRVILVSGKQEINSSQHLNLLARRYLAGDTILHRRNVVFHQKKK